MTKFNVTLTVEADEVINEDVKDFVVDAVSCWGGQFRPDHPFFPSNMKVTKTKVKRDK